MATFVEQFFSNPLMQSGTVRTWTWKHGDRDVYWGFCVRPFQANMTAEVVRLVATSDNDTNQVTNLTVRAVDTSAGPGPFPGQLRFTAIKVFMA